VEEIHKLADKFTCRGLKFMAVYIVEAHAVDEWPVGDPLKVNQPRTLAERCGVARAFVGEYNLRIPMVVDHIDNNFSEKYAGWPVRFYVIDPVKMKLLFKARPDEKNTYDSVPRLLDSFLENILPSY